MTPLAKKMERRLLKAAMDGSVVSLLNLLQEDALVLDRFVAGCYAETPLHVASMLGHVEFVDQVLALKPELAKELDRRKASPLHLATSKGYLDIVRRLLRVDPDMCLACDRDGRNPLHIAAIKGHINVLKELVQARPQAARMLMKGGETSLHACVRYNQLEALKFLVEALGDHEFVNSKNNDGNTILHLAVADQQIQAVNFLMASTSMEINSLNANGYTPLDLLSQNGGDLKDMEIAALLQNAGAVSAGGSPLSEHELEAMRSRILSSSPASNRIHPLFPPNNIDGKKPVQSYSDWLEKKRNALMVVASLIATMAFQAGTNPPSGVWQDSNESNSTLNSHTAGSSIMAYNTPDRYQGFLTYNTTGFVASLSIILLLISGLPFRRRIFAWILMVIMWIAITSMAMTYVLSILAYTPSHASTVSFRVLVVVMLVWGFMMMLLLLGHSIRLFVKMIRYHRKSMQARELSGSRVMNSPEFDANDLV